MLIQLAGIAGISHGTAAALTISGATCRAIANGEIPTVTISLAELVPAGGFKAPESVVPLDYPDRPDYRALPAFCRVAGEVSYSRDGSVGLFELWIPAEGWDGGIEGGGGTGYLPGATIAYPIPTRLKQPFLEMNLAVYEILHVGPQPNGSGFVFEDKALMDALRAQMTAIATHARKLTQERAPARTPDG